MRCRFSAEIELRPFIAAMADDFAEEYHEVCLIPSKDEGTAKDGGMIRVATNRNPKWYRDLCTAFPKRGAKPKKKPRSSVEKIDVLNAIRSLSVRGVSTSKYAPLILDEAKRRFEADGFVAFVDQF